MNGLRLAAMAWRNLLRNRRRTLLTVIGLVFGGFLAVMMTAMLDRSFADTIDLAARLGGGHVIVQHREYIDTPSLTRTVDGTDVIRAAAEQNPYVKKAVERITGQGMISTASHNAGMFFIAFDPKAEDETTLSFLQGVVQGAPLAETTGTSIVLGTRLAKNLDVGIGGKVVYTLIDRKGEIVGGMGRVSGIVGTGAASVDGALVLLPIERLRDLVGYGPHEATEVCLFLNDYRNAPSVARSLAPVLPATADALVWYDVKPDLAGIIAMKVGGSRFMEMVTLIMVAAGIFNTLFVSVMERMREFGIMRAIGYSPGQISLLVMWESLWLGVAGLVGASLVTAWPYYYLSTHGIDLTAQYKTQAIEVAGIGMPMVLQIGIFPNHLAVIYSVMLAMTLLAGLYPAWKAGRVVPVEAIKLV